MKIFKPQKLSVLLLAFITATLFIADTTSEAQQRKRKKETAKSALVITDYEWRSGGRGREGILNSVTIENVGKEDYENISIEIEFISNNDVPQGSLRTIITDNLVSGSTKTFSNVSLGIMNTDLEKTVIRITGAKIVERGIDSPKDVIFVKDWEWLETNYGTEGILKFITLENKSDKNYKKIEINIDFQGTGDSRAVPQRTLIHGYLPANSEKTFENINVGFKYRGARGAVISVRDASKITRKEYRSLLAKDGIRVDENTPGIESYPESDELQQRDKRLSLAERYRKYVLKVDPETGEQRVEGIEDTEAELQKEVLIDEPQDDSYAYYRDRSQAPTRVDNAISEEQLLREQASIFPEVFQEIVIVSAQADSFTEEPVRQESRQPQNYERHRIEYKYEDQKKEKGVFGRAFNWSKNLVGLGDDEEEEYELVETTVAVRDTDTQQPSGGQHPYTSVSRVDGNTIEYENISEDDYLIESDEDYEALPRIDIEIRDYRVKPGIVNTIGQLEEITLVNRSNITYTNIKIEVNFLSRGATKKLGSNQFVINEILPKRTRRTFRNVDIGFLNTVPEELKLRIVDAIDIN